MNTETTVSTCPRRMNELGPWEREEGLDAWMNGRGLVGQEGFLSCSFCGSLHPDTFMAMVEDGAVVGPCDKAYKCYLHGKADPALREQRRQQWMDRSVARAIADVLRDEGKSEPEIAAALERQWSDVELPLVHGPTIAKFYFQHLSAEQRTRFVELVNTAAMTIGHPGYFYVPPFFMVPV